MSVHIRIGKARHAAIDARLEAIFWSFVDRRGDDDCWRWTGKVYNGHPMFVRTEFGIVPAGRIAVVLTAGEDVAAGRRIKGCKLDALCVNPRHMHWHDPVDVKHVVAQQAAESSAPLQLPPELTRLAAASGQDISKEDLAAATRENHRGKWKRPEKKAADPDKVKMTEAQRIYYFLVQHVTHYVRFRSGSVILTGDSFGKVHESSLAEAVEKAQALVAPDPAAVGA